MVNNFLNLTSLMTVQCNRFSINVRLPGGPWHVHLSLLDQLIVLDQNELRAGMVALASFFCLFLEFLSDL